MLRTQHACRSAHVHTHHRSPLVQALGVDNARVEVEEGAELPVLDGSAEGWTRGVRDAGVVAARDASGAQLPRTVPKPPNTVLVSEGDSFIVFNPEVSRSPSDPPPPRRLSFPPAAPPSCQARDTARQSHDL
jgi:UDP-3-O-acyl-N-acetylglucosamine deacetylase